MGGQALMFDTRELLVFALEAGVAAAVVFFAWPWGRRNNRFAVAAVTTAVGVVAWNLTLRHTAAFGFQADAPTLRVSWQDVGSGVVVFLCTALVFGLVAEQAEQARRVVGASALAGLVTTALAAVLF
jgi:hypothetical protein